MLYTLSRAAGLSLVCALSAMSSVSHAAVTKTVVTFKGETVSAEFDKVTEKTCADGVSTGSYYEQVIVAAYHNTTLTDHVSTSEVSDVNVYYSYLDTCTFEYDANSVDITDPYKQAQVEHARIMGTFVIPSFTGPAPMATVNLDLRLEGTGIATVDQGNERVLDGVGGRQVTRWFGTNREATATGIVSVGGEDFLSDFTAAQLGFSKSGVVTVTKL